MTDWFAVPAVSRGRNCLRYRVDVVARDAAEVVHRAGGWIFDYAMQGWVVNVVLTPKPGDTRPLQILGATVNDTTVERAQRSAAQLSLTTDDVVGSEVIEHRLSAAARRFKAHALVAAHLSPTVGAQESFRVSKLSGISAHPSVIRADKVVLEASAARALTPVPAS